jgi:hypothetical protein
MPGRHERRKRTRREERTPADHEAWVNQRQHEPLPASSRAEGDHSAVARNEEHSAGRQEASGGPGQAVRDLMGGPQPQGDVPDAPATQIAAAENEEDQVGQIRYVANAVPGKPDGEVDTRS